MISVAEIIKRTEQITFVLTFGGFFVPVTAAPPTGSIEQVGQVFTDVDLLVKTDRTTHTHAEGRDNTRKRERYSFVPINVIRVNCSMKTDLPVTQAFVSRIRLWTTFPRK